jgi:hypothetical protein
MRERDGRGLRVARLGQRSALGGDGLITYIREITRGLRELGALAADRVLERYSLDRNIDALLGIYAELRDQRPRTERLDRAG